MSENLHMPLTGGSQAPVQRDRRSGRVPAIMGVLLLLSPLVGVAITVLTMIRAFSASSESGSADPSLLAGDISVALEAAVWGSILGVVGVALLGLALLWKKNRERWFMEWGITALVIGGLSSPVVLLPAIYFTCVFISRRAEFRPANL